MAKKWTASEIKEFLAETNPIVRKLFRSLLKIGKARTKDLGVPVASVAISMRIFNIKKKAPLYKATRPKDGGPALYSIEPAYKRAIATFFSKFKEPGGTMAKKKKTTRKKRTTRKKKVTRRKKPGRKKKVVRRRKKTVTKRKKTTLKKTVRKRAVKRGAKKKVGRKRGRKPRGRRPAAGGTVLTVPYKSARDIAYWVKLATAINTAKGNTLIVTTDGKKISLQMQ